MTIKGDTDTIAKATRIAERANIRDIRLFETSAEIKDLSISGPLQWDLGVAPAVSYSTGDDYFVISISYEITIEKAADSDSQKDEEKGEEEVAKISFRFGGLYELEPDKSSHETIGAEEIDAYARTIAIHTLYPYAREYVHDVTMRMGLPPLVMDFVSAPADEAKV